MVLLLVGIPVMVLAVAIAVLPLLAAIRREAAERRVCMVPVDIVRDLGAFETLPIAA